MTLSHISQPGQAASDPLLLYLHGAGEVGGDPVQQLHKHGPWTNALYDPRNAYRSDTAAALRHFHVLAFHLQDGDWDGAALDAELVTYLAAHPAVDRGRLFLTGVSRGGRGVLRLAIQRLRAGRPVTAIASFCPAGGVAEYSDADIVLLRAVWMASQAHVVPYIVTVDKLGEAVAVHRVPVAPPADPGRIKAQLARWIVDTRTVYTDPSAELNVVTEAYGWTDRSSDALGQLDSWFSANNPNERAKKVTVGVSIDSVGQIGTDTWSVDWSEETRGKDGVAPAISYWRASIRIKVDPPTDDATILANPGGVYVEWFKTTPRVK